MAVPSIQHETLVFFINVVCPRKWSQFTRTFLCRHELKAMGTCWFCELRIIRANCDEGEKSIENPENRYSSTVFSLYVFVEHTFCAGRAQRTPHIHLPSRLLLYISIDFLRNAAMQNINYYYYFWRTRCGNIVQNNDVCALRQCSK